MVSPITLHCKVVYFIDKCNITIAPLEIRHETPAELDRSGSRVLI